MLNYRQRLQPHLVLNNCCSRREKPCSYEIPNHTLPQVKLDYYDQGPNTISESYRRQRPKQYEGFCFCRFYGQFCFNIDSDYDF